MADSPIARTAPGDAQRGEVDPGHLERIHRQPSQGASTPCSRKPPRAKAVDEVRDVCEEHLGHTKNSIIALYLSGIISLSRQQIDDSNMVALIDIFADNQQVEHRGVRLPAHPRVRREPHGPAHAWRSATRTRTRPEEMYAVWERLVRVDYEEADIVKAARGTPGEGRRHRGAPSTSTARRSTATSTRACSPTSRRSGAS
ncbi:MAG: hypothetical protein MZU97_12495 [Bacillus subtilis]|nr:hypothetical protein [Bacillus subtilis]